MKYIKIFSFCIIVFSACMIGSTSHLAHGQSTEPAVELITQKCVDDPWNCDMCEALKIVSNLLPIITYSILPILGVGFMYAGFIFVTKGNNPAERLKAGRILLNMFIGMAFVLGAYFIVDTFYSIIGVDASYRQLFEGVSCPN